jgi:hypothetical protein
MANECGSDKTWFTHYGWLVPVTLGDLRIHVFWGD